MVKLQEKIQSESQSVISKEEALDILNGKLGLLETLFKANVEREKYFSKKVRIHILDNIKNGHCPEDCGYCAQRKNANSGVQTYSLKPEDEIFEDAKRAKENGAYRFCIVTAGTGPNETLINSLSSTINRITRDLGMRVCLSAGLLDESKAAKLKEAGLDRYNHNLNTSESHYGEICTTHTFKDRLNTLEFVKNSEIGICSGLIVGMGESFSDLVDVAFTLKRLGVISIPVNFFIPVAGHAIQNPNVLNPELCLRILSVFRLVNPDSEIRIGAGREGHLKSLQAMGLFAANSLFASGYLNVKGSEVNQTIEMIRDAGFEPELDGGILPEDLGATTHLYAKENIENLYKYKK
ncbi:MAG: biotin synthase BioB [Leptospiraceae bacterium]|nr:biotin synthase BioB [Leptospiraceae bacterium]